MPRCTRGGQGIVYRMKEFSAMTGLPQSKVRFYEKHGLVLSDRQENGYRVFTELHLMQVLHQVLIE